MRYQTIFLIIMRQFLKFTLATIVGILITTFIIGLIFFGIIGAAVKSADKTVSLLPKSVYQLELKGELVERSEDDPFSKAFAGSMGRESVASIGLDDVLANIRKAKNDDNIAGIYLRADALLAGYASVKEIRDALEDFKESGKFIVSYADTYSQKTYYLCSVADKVYLNKFGMLEFQGISSNSVFFKNTLDKLGVEMQIVKVGTFKSAVEPFIQTKMSDANREQVTVFANTIWSSMLDEISASRGISKETLNNYADEVLTFKTSEEMVQYNMVDSLVYIDGMEQILKNMLEVDDVDDIHLVQHADFTNVPDNKKMEKQKVAIIYAVGGIDIDPNAGIISKELVETIRQVKDEESVKAVVFRINSGGGSAYGSEQIWHSLTELKKEKPLIVSMGDYAASGGYYIAAPADTILAQPNTLTGSIGIFGTIPNIAGLNKKIGITHDGVKTNKMSDAISINRPFTPEERNMMQAFVNRGYETFTGRCAEGRNMSIDSIKAIAEGRVWTGLDAKRIGLVDELGGLTDAVNIAARKAGLDNYMVKEYPKKKDFMTKLLQEFNTTASAKILKSQLGEENYVLYRQVQEAKSFNGIYTVMPFNISFH